MAALLRQIDNRDLDALGPFWLAAREITVHPDSTVTVAARPGFDAEVYRKMALDLYADSTVRIYGPSVDLGGMVRWDTLRITRLIHHSQALQMNRSDIRADFVRGGLPVKVSDTNAATSVRPNLAQTADRWPAELRGRWYVRDGGAVMVVALHDRGKLTATAKTLYSAQPDIIEGSWSVAYPSTGKSRVLCLQFDGLTKRSCQRFRIVPVADSDGHRAAAKTIRLADGSEFKEY